MHAKIWKAQDKAQARWSRMSRAERRRALRRIRRAERRTWVRARAAAGEPSEVGSWALAVRHDRELKGYAIHAAMLHTGKVLMWGYPIHRERPFRGNERTRGSGTRARETSATRGQGRHAEGLDGNERLDLLLGDVVPPGRQLLVVGGTLAGPRRTRPTSTTIRRPRTARDLRSLHRDLEGAAAAGRLARALVPDAGPARRRPDARRQRRKRTTPGRHPRTKAQEIYDPEGNAFTLLDEPTQRERPGCTRICSRCPTARCCWPGPTRDDSAIFDPGNLRPVDGPPAARAPADRRQRGPAARGAGGLDEGRRDRRASVDEFSRRTTRCSTSTTRTELVGLPRSAYAAMEREHGGAARPVAGDDRRRRQARRPTTGGAAAELYDRHGNMDGRPEPGRDARIPLDGGAPAGRAGAFDGGRAESGRRRARGQSANEPVRSTRRRISSRGRDRHPLGARSSPLERPVRGRQEGRSTTRS